MKRLYIEDTPIEGLCVIKRQPIGDERGYLERFFCAEELEEVIGKRGVVQANRTLTVKAGTVRGMHFQHPPYGEMKLVSCLQGEVFDVAVDLRRGSTTFLQWHAEILSADNHRTFCVPEGFAHGFQALTDDCEMFYLHTAAHQPEAEAGLCSLDPRIDIKWPMPIAERSARDKNFAMLTSEFSGLSI